MPDAGDNDSPCTSRYVCSAGWGGGSGDGGLSAQRAGASNRPAAAALAQALDLRPDVRVSCGQPTVATA